MIVHQTLPIIVAKLLQLTIKMVPKSNVDDEFVSNGAKHNHTHLTEFGMLFASSSGLDPRSLEKLFPSEIANAKSKFTVWANTANL